VLVMTCFVTDNFVRSSHQPGWLLGMSVSVCGNARARSPILQELLRVVAETIPSEQLVLEVASGTGCHVEHFAPAFPHLTFHPTEYVPDEASAPEGTDLGRIGTYEGSQILATIDAHGAKQNKNVQPAAALDAASPFAKWPVRFVLVQVIILPRTLWRESLLRLRGEDGVLCTTCSTLREG
jgi:hypothetical protein